MQPKAGFDFARLEWSAGSSLPFQVERVQSESPGQILRLVGGEAVYSSYRRLKNSVEYRRRTDHADIGIVFRSFVGRSFGVFICDLRTLFLEESACR